MSKSNPTEIELNNIYLDVIRGLQASSKGQLLKRKILIGQREELIGVLSALSNELDAIVTNIGNDENVDCRVRDLVVEARGVIAKSTGTGYANAH